MADPSRACGSNLPTGSDRALGLVDFTLYPHLDHPSMPENSLANAERWAARVAVPAYAIDDQTAIKVIDGSRRSRLRGPLETVCALMGCLGTGSFLRATRARSTCIMATRDQCFDFKASGVMRMILFP